MASIPDPLVVATEDRYIHVRYRDPVEFDTIRTPEWADRVSDSVSDGSEVRMGKRRAGDEWIVQSVLFATSVGEEKARQQAKEVIEKIES